MTLSVFNAASFFGRQRGAAIVDLAVVAPILTMLAACVGSVGNASMTAIRQAFTAAVLQHREVTEESGRLACRSAS